MHIKVWVCGAVAGEAVDKLVALSWVSILPAILGGEVHGGEMDGAFVSGGDRRGCCGCSGQWGC